MQRGGQVHILLDDVVIVRAVIVGPINPGNDPGVDPVGIVQFAPVADVGDQGRFHHVRQGADDNHAPRGVVGVLSFLRFIGNHPEHLAVIVQARGALPLFQVRFGNERENALGGLHQQGIAPVVAVAVGRSGNRAERTDRADFRRRRHREKALIGVGPLLHPALRSLRDDIGRRLRVFQRFHVTEGDAVVVEL